MFQKRNRNKYNAKRTTFNGREYASKAEARRAFELKAIQHHGLVVFVEPQPVVFLSEARIKYIPDFRVIGADRREWWEDVKGVETERFRVCRQLWAVYGPGPLHIRRMGKPVQIVLPSPGPPAAADSETDTETRTRPH